MPQSPNAPILPDFVFGGIESDESRLLANERARWQGIRPAVNDLSAVRLWAAGSGKM